MVLLPPLAHLPSKPNNGRSDAVGSWSRLQQADEAFEYPAIDDSSQDNEQEGFKRVVENGYWGYLIHVTALRRVRG